ERVAAADPPDLEFVAIQVGAVVPDLEALGRRGGLRLRGRQPKGQREAEGVDNSAHVLSLGMRFHSARMLASCTTFRHISISRRMVSPNCCGVPPAGATPSFCSCSSVSLSLSDLAAAALIRLTISGGIPLGP